MLLHPWACLLRFLAFSESQSAYGVLRLLEVAKVVATIFCGCLMVQPDFPDGFIDSQDLVLAGLVSTFLSEQFEVGKRANLNCLRGTKVHLIKNLTPFLQRLPL